MTTETTAPDAALLWARTSFAAHLRLIGPTHHEMADEVLAGEHDTILGSRAEAFRAGQSHADAGLRAEVARDRGAVKDAFYEAYCAHPYSPDAHTAWDKSKARAEQEHDQ